MKHVKIYIIAILAIFFFVGCSGGSTYSATAQTDKFAPQNGQKSIRTTGNILWYSNPFGNQHTPTLDVVVSLDEKSQCISKTRFVSVYPRLYSTAYTHTMNTSWLDIRKGHRLIVLADGKRLVFPVIGSRADTDAQGYNQVSRSVSSYYIDKAIYAASVDQIRTIASARTVELRIESMERNVDLGKGVLNVNFGKNIKKFYLENMASRKTCS